MKNKNSSIIFLIIIIYLKDINTFYLIFITIFSYSIKTLKTIFSKFQKDNISIDLFLNL